jgi:glycosyltransferase involved in cell wall biosynthesis
VGEDGAGHYDERVVNDLCRPIDVVRTGYAEDADLPALVGGSCALLYPSLWEGLCPSGKRV